MPATELKAIVSEKKYVTPTVFEIRFKVEPQISFLAGQFVSVVIPGAGPKGRDLRRAYSIASSPEDPEIELCIKKVEGGPGTTYIDGLKVGEPAKIFAPYGDFIYKTPKTRDVCFIATGTGVSPFRSILNSNAYREGPAAHAACLFGVRHEKEILYQEELGNYTGLRWVPCVSRPEGSWSGYAGRVSQYLKEQFEDLVSLNTDFYLCGNGEMIKEVKEFLNSKDIPKSQIYTEKYY